MIQVFDAPYVLLAFLAALAGLASLGQQRRLKKKYVPIRIDDNKTIKTKGHFNSGLFYDLITR